MKAYATAGARRRSDVPHGDVSRGGWRAALVGLLASAGLVLGAAALASPREGWTDRAGGHRGQPSAAQMAPAHGGNFAQCPQMFPRNAVIDVAAVDRQWRATALCSSHFAVLHSGLAKTPLVVVERLNRDQMERALDKKRTDEFYPDPRLQRGQRAELDDFRGSGFDRGHLAPAGDQPSQAGMAQSFALSNIVAQDPVNNRKTWAKIEADVRKFVRRAHGNVYVFSGPLFRGGQRTVGRNQVWVPSHLFKLVYDEASGRSWAYVLANTAQARVEAPVDYAEFVKQTGWSLLARTPG